MNKTTPDNEITAYLLGMLSRADCERLDELSIANDEFADALNAREKDLVDAYVKGELSGTDLERFKSYYMASTVRREKVEFAEAFRGFAARSAAQTVHDPKRNPVELAREERGWRSLSRLFTRPRLALQWGTALAALVLLIVGGWFFVENNRLRQQVAQTEERRNALAVREQQLQSELDNQRTANSTTEQELERLREEREQLDLQLRETQPASRANNIAAFILTPQMRGSGQIRTISIPTETTKVRIGLELEPNDFEIYQVALVDSSNGQIVWRSGRLTATGAGDRRTVSLSLQAERLKPQTYALRLSGVLSAGGSETIGDYPFRVTR